MQPSLPSRCRRSSRCRTGRPAVSARRRGDVGEHLRRRPVQAARVRARDDLAVHRDLQLDVERVGRRRRAGSGSGSGSCSRAGAVGRSSNGHDPRRDRRRERLAEERAERHVLQRLDVARAPVVQQHDAEDARLGSVTKPSSHSKSSAWRRAERGRRPAGRRGRAIGVPDTTTPTRARGSRPAGAASSARAARPAGTCARRSSRARATRRSRRSRATRRAAAARTRRAAAGRRASARRRSRDLAAQSARPLLDQGTELRDHVAEEHDLVADPRRGRGPPAPGRTAPHPKQLRPPPSGAACATTQRVASGRRARGRACVSRSGRNVSHITASSSVSRRAERLLDQRPAAGRAAGRSGAA